MKEDVLGYAMIMDVEDPYVCYDDPTVHVRIDKTNIMHERKVIYDRIGDKAALKAHDFFIEDHDVYRHNLDWAIVANYEGVETLDWCPDSYVRHILFGADEPDHRPSSFDSRMRSNIDLDEQLYRLAHQRSTVPGVVWSWRIKVFTTLRENGLVDVFARDYVIEIMDAANTPSMCANFTTKAKSVVESEKREMYLGSLIMPFHPPSGGQVRHRLDEMLKSQQQHITHRIRNAAA